MYYTVFVSRDSETNPSLATYTSPSETVNSIARDTRKEYYEPFLVVGEYILKLY